MKKLFRKRLAKTGLNFFAKRLAKTQKFSTELEILNWIEKFSMPLEILNAIGNSDWKKLKQGLPKFGLKQTRFFLKQITSRNTQRPITHIPRNRLNQP